MASDKLFAEWFWTDRWVGSSAFLLPIDARGLYREMLTQAWRRGGSLPNNHEAIRRAVGVTKREWNRCWPLIERFWREEGSSLVNDTQLEVYADAKARQETHHARAKKGAEARWGKEKPQAMLKHPNKDVLKQSPLSPVTSHQSPGRQGEAAPLTAGTLPRDHRNHACCGVVCLHRTLFTEFVRKARSEPDPEAYVERFFGEWNERYQHGDRATDKIAEDQFDFWRKRWAESHPSASQVNTSGQKTAAAAGRVAQILRGER